MPLLFYSEGMEKKGYAKKIRKRAGVAVRTSDKIDFKMKIITRHKEGTYKMIKGTVQEDIVIKMSKINDKEKILKQPKGKKIVT